MGRNLMTDIVIRTGGFGSKTHTEGRQYEDTEKTAIDKASREASEESHSTNI